MKYLAERMNGEFNGFWKIEERDGDLVCVNRFGGWHNYCRELGDEFYEVDRYEDLPFAKYLISDKYKTGWLDRDGKFYGCEWEQHSNVAWYCFGKEEEELEKGGWIKITKSVARLFSNIDKDYFSNTNGDLDYYYLSEWPMTAEQINWLNENGFQV